jgi:ribosomal subunit interface protein
MANNRDRDVSIEVVSRHQHVSEKTRDFATEKAGRLTRFNSRISRIQVLLDERHEDFISEFIVHVDSGATIVSKEAASGYRASIISAVEKLERQLKKDKEKRQNHKHDSLGAAPEPSMVGMESEKTYEEIVEEDLTA